MIRKRTQKLMINSTYYKSALFQQKLTGLQQSVQFTGNPLPPPVWSLASAGVPSHPPKQLSCHIQLPKHDQRENSPGSFL